MSEPVFTRFLRAAAAYETRAALHYYSGTRTLSTYREQRTNATAPLAPRSSRTVAATALKDSPRSPRLPPYENSPPLTGRPVHGLATSIDRNDRPVFSTFALIGGEGGFSRMCRLVCGCAYPICPAKLIHPEDTRFTHWDPSAVRAP